MNEEEILQKLKEINHKDSFLKLKNSVLDWRQAMDQEMVIMI